MNTSAAESDLTNPLEPGLYIVATPIGNLGDITLRAVDVLRRCDVVACEDTRVTGKLLKALNISKRMQRYDDHASSSQRERLIEAMRTGAVALVSDAGTPLISDPGFRLVQAVREQGIAVTSIPGASAVIVGLTLAGLPNDRFLFAGFLPQKDKARRDVLDEFENVAATLIFYETGPRLAKSLAAIAEQWPDREVTVARELTKLHEECRSGSPRALCEHYQNHAPKGEIVLLVGPPAATTAAAVDLDTLLRDKLQEMKPSQAASSVAKLTGADRKTLYARAMELKDE